LKATEPVVWIVDDDASVRTSLARLARSAGFNSATFASAEEFLFSLPKTAAPACAVVDIHMPGMSGLELAEQISMRAPWLSVILMTGFADVPDITEECAGCVIALLKKPFDDAALLRAVLEALDRKDAANGKGGRV
jgi:two-component system response regulator FixJ